MTIRSVRRCFLGLLASFSLFGQAKPARPEFEVASIKPSPPAGVNQVRVGVHVDGSQVSFISLSLNDLVGAAYRTRNYEIFGPAWMASERFDINATLPAGSSPKQVPEMLGALLEDRFQMKMHREKRELPVYGLVLGKGELNLRESPPDPAAQDSNGNEGRGGVNVSASGQASGVTINYGNGAYFTFANDKLEGRKLPAALMADVLARFADRPVINMTELKGNYDFVLELSPEDFRAMMIRSAVGAGVALPPQALQLAEAASGDSLFSSVEKLGLKLEPRKAPVDALVIDHIEKAPTEN